MKDFHPTRKRQATSSVADVTTASSEHVPAWRTWLPGWRPLLHHKTPILSSQESR